jgi:hypothetical protein
MKRDKVSVTNIAIFDSDVHFWYLMWLNGLKIK